MPDTRFRCDLGRIIDGRACDRHGRGTPLPLRLSGEELEKHVAVLGGSGFGKSRLLSRFVRDHIDRGEGIMVLEPGDLCDDTLAYYASRVVETGSKGITGPGSRATRCSC